MSMVGKRVEATPVLKALAKEPPELVTELPAVKLSSNNASRMSPTLKLDG